MSGLKTVIEEAQDPGKDSHHGQHISAVRLFMKQQRHDDNDPYRTCILQNDRIGGSCHFVRDHKQACDTDK